LFSRIQVILLAAWAIIKVLSGKFKHLSEPHTFLFAMVAISQSFVIMVAILSFVIVSLHLIGVSRLLAYGSCVLFYLFEVAGYALYYLVRGKKHFGIHAAARPAPTIKDKMAVNLAIADAFLLFAAFGVSTWLKRGGIAWSDDNLDMLPVLFGLWLVSSLATRKFGKKSFSSYYSAVAPCIKAALLMAAGLALIVFGLRLFYFSRIQIFGAIPLLLVFELVLFFVYYRYRSYGGHIRDIDSAEDVRQLLAEEKEEFPALAGAVRDPVEEKLNNALDFLNPTLFTFIRNSIDLSGIDRNEAAVIFSESRANTVAWEKNQFRLIINIEKLNDIRWINQYFLAIHVFLKGNGYLVGIAQTTDNRMSLFLKRFPKRSARVLYLADFVVHRVLPKLPFTKKIYFALTKGRNRSISRAEILGRLYFCGFKAFAEMEDGDRYFFIAQKPKSPPRIPPLRTGHWFFCGEAAFSTSRLRCINSGPCTPIQNSCKVISTRRIFLRREESSRMISA
jgi:hypothetical protein